GFAKYIRLMPDKRHRPEKRTLFSFHDQYVGAHRRGRTPTAIGPARPRPGTPPPTPGRTGTHVRALPPWPRTAVRRLGDAMAALAGLPAAVRPRRRRGRVPRGLDARRDRARRGRLRRRGRTDRDRAGLPRRAGRGTGPGGGRVRPGALREARR